MFELARETDSVDRLEEDVAALRDVLNDSADLQNLITSPIYERAEVANAITRIAQRMELGQYLANTLGLMASRRRLFALPWLLDHLDKLINEHKGVVTAEIISARPLSDAEIGKVAAVLESKVGKRVDISMSVDPGLIGGMIARLGSRMIDDSMRSKLLRMKNAMQEVG